VTCSGQTVVVRSDLWQVVRAERAALVADLAGLRSEQWATPSLCDGWDIHDVVAHLAATATLSYIGFVKEFLLAGLSPSRIADKQVRAGRLRRPAESLSALRSAIEQTVSPPQPTITRLIEIIVHGEDIRRPLQIHHDYSTSYIAEAPRLPRERPSLWRQSPPGGAQPARDRCQLCRRRRRSGRRVGSVTSSCSNWAARRSGRPDRTGTTKARRPAQVNPPGGTRGRRRPR
jgi:uncharacterized protein (TIGR03083 family)